jgi:hypothetical protein
MRSFLFATLFLALISCGDELIVESNRLAVFPSPFTHSFSVHVENQGLPYHLDVFDPDGKLILEMHNLSADSSHNQRMIDATSYPSGKFHVVLEIENQKIIKNAIKL